MTYFSAEDTKISGKWIHLISRSMDIMNQSANQPVCPSILDRRLIFINDLFRFRRYKIIRRMDSTYNTECGYKGSVSQPISLSVCP